MTSGNPRTGSGLTAIVTVAAAIVAALWFFSAPPEHRRVTHPKPALAHAAHLPATHPASESSSGGGSIVVELPPTIPSDQRAPHTAAITASQAAIPGFPAQRYVRGTRVRPPTNAGWVDYFAPPAAGGAASLSVGGPSPSTQVASNGNGLMVGIISGGGTGSDDERATRTAGVLHPGWVLIEGGWSGRKSATRKAELFNPERMRWIRTGAMHHARQNHTATPLPDGDTLIAGGENHKGKALASAELYDSAKGKFLKTGSMKTARGGHTATLIAGCSCAEDGKVLIAGGTTLLSGGNPLASAELYDPTSGEFSPTGPMKVARSGATATLIESGPMAGDVLIAGGIGRGGAILASAELYDPRTATFSDTGSMAVAREYHAATWLGYLKDSGSMAGEILITGGNTPSGVVASAEVYDPSAGTFSPIASMTTARAAQNAVLMDDGRVLIAGGFGSSENFLNSAEIFDPATGGFAPTAAMTSTHVGAAGILLIDGRVLIAGGRSPDADVYDPATGIFQMTKPMIVALLDAPAAALP